MLNKNLIIILLLFLIASISGCTTKNATNGTFGQKNVSINNITIINNVTADHTEVDGVKYYYITGYLKNYNNNEVFNLKMKATAYDSEGNVVAVNDTVYLESRILPIGEEVYFGFNFQDNDNRIVRYELKIISADAEA